MNSIISILKKAFFCVEVNGSDVLCFRCGQSTYFLIDMLLLNSNKRLAVTNINILYGMEPQIHQILAL